MEIQQSTGFLPLVQAHIRNLNICDMLLVWIILINTFEQCKKLSDTLTESFHATVSLQ